ncbi:MAG: hypothetical protein FD143_2926 [Ignavibacteria bacterium]|nr:MAG: hypothetical protein FD143_2926 [Ignavibacteria bacterium]
MYLFFDYVFFGSCFVGSFLSQGVGKFFFLWFFFVSLVGLFCLVGFVIGNEILFSFF